MATVERHAEHRDLAAADYHADPAIGSSMIETFRRSRREFHAKYIAKAAGEDEPTPAMILGTLTHLLLLEPEKVSEQFTTLPTVNSAGEPWNWYKPSHRDERDCWIAAQGGKRVVEAEVWSTAVRMQSAVLANWHARRLLGGDGEPEFSIFWTDKETGLECKCRVDWMATIPLDLKTTADPAPEAYARALVSLGYHRKLAHYLDGLAHFLGEPTPMVHLAVGNSEPFLVATYDIDDRDIRGKSLGARQRRAALRLIAACMADDDWREPWEKQITTLRLPNWAFSEDSYQLGD